MSIMLGTDPEVFVAVNGNIIPCVGKVPGTKVEPFTIQGHRHGLAIQEDGVTLEFNIQAVEDSVQFASAIRNCIVDLQATVLPNYLQDASIVIEPVHKFSPEDLNSEQAMTFGCDPDLQAWNNGAFRRPPSVKEVGLNRFAGGHIHFGYDKENTEIPGWALIQFIEVMWYLPSCIRNGYDKQRERRGFYGLAGLYREKDYGVEYRTPSNFWINNPRAYGLEHAHTAVKEVLSKPTAARAAFALISNKAKDIQDCVAREKLSKEVSVLSDKVWDIFQHHLPEREV